MNPLPEYSETDGRIFLIFGSGSTLSTWVRKMRIQNSLMCSLFIICICMSPSLSDWVADPRGDHTAPDPNLKKKKPGSNGQGKTGSGSEFIFLSWSDQNTRIRNPALRETMTIFRERYFGSQLPTFTKMHPYVRNFRKNVAILKIACYIQASEWKMWPSNENF